MWSKMSITFRRAYHRPILAGPLVRSAALVAWVITTLRNPYQITAVRHFLTRYIKSTWRSPPHPRGFVSMQLPSSYGSPPEVAGRSNGSPLGSRTVLSAATTTPLAAAARTKARTRHGKRQQLAMMELFLPIAQTLPRQRSQPIGNQTSSADWQSDELSR